MSAADHGRNGDMLAPSYIKQQDRAFRLDKGYRHC